MLHESLFRGRTRGAALVGLALLGCALACGTYLERGGRLVPPEVSVSDIAPVDGPGLEPRVRVDLRLGNPNDVPLEIDGLRFRLDLNGRPFARGQTGELVTIPRLGDARMSVVVTTGVLDILRQIDGVAAASELNYRISGDVFLSKPSSRTLPFRYQSD